MTSTSERLEQYRRRKQEQERKEERKELIWNTITLQALRRRVLPDINSEAGEGNNSEDQEQEDESEEKKPWTTIDWAIFSTKILVWICMQVIFVKIEFGAVFFLVSCILLMTSNLGKRKAGEASAYSVFNKNCEAIDGTLTAQQFEREIRHGPAAAAN